MKGKSFFQCIVCFFRRCDVLGFFTQPLPRNKCCFQPVSVNGATTTWHSEHLFILLSKSSTNPFPNLERFSHSSNKCWFIAIISTTRREWKDLKRERERENVSPSLFSLLVPQKAKGQPTTYLGHKMYMTLNMGIPSNNACPTYPL